MEIEPTIPPSVIFSDGVIREERTGKLTLVGTFHHFNPPTPFPFRAPPFFITVSLSNFRGKLDRFKIASNVLSPSDTVQIPFQVMAEFPRAGLYAVVILEGSEPIGSRDLIVIEPKPAA